MDETMRSERRILNERWVLEKSVQTSAVPLQSAVQSALIIREMTTIEFSLNLTLQFHFMFSEYEDQTSVCQFNIVIFNELRGTVPRQRFISIALKEEYITLQTQSTGHI